MNSSSKRENSGEWARHLMARPNGFLVLDTETNGWDGKSEIIELAIINHLGVVLFNQRLRPINPIPPKVSEVHGITDADVANCSSFGNLYHEIRAILRRREIVCFNAAFDMRLLDQTCQRFYMPQYAGTLSSHCAMMRYREHAGVRKGTLVEACSALGITTKANTHSALGDSLLTLELVKAMAEDKS